METFSAIPALLRGIYRSLVNSPHKGQWHEALMFFFIWARTNGLVNNQIAGDLRRYRAHYDVTVMRRSSGAMWIPHHKGTIIPERFPDHDIIKAYWQIVHSILMTERFSVASSWAKVWRPLHITIDYGIILNYVLPWTPIIDMII